MSPVSKVCSSYSGRDDGGRGGRLVALHSNERIVRDELAVVVVGDGAARSELGACEGRRSERCDDGEEGNECEEGRHGGTGVGWYRDVGRDDDVGEGQGTRWRAKFSRLSCDAGITFATFCSASAVRYDKMMLRASCLKNRRDSCSASQIVLRCPVLAGEVEGACRRRLDSAVEACPLASQVAERTGLGYKARWSYEFIGCSSVCIWCRSRLGLLSSRLRWANHRCDGSLCSREAGPRRREEEL